MSDPKWSSKWSAIFDKIRKGFGGSPICFLKHACEWPSFYFLMICGNWTILLAEACFWVVPFGRCCRQLRTIGFMIRWLDSSKQKVYSIQQLNLRIDVLLLLGEERCSIKARSSFPRVFFSNPCSCHDLTQKVWPPRVYWYHWGWGLEVMYWIYCCWRNHNFCHSWCWANSLANPTTKILCWS